MDPLDETHVGVTRLRNLQAALYKTVAEDHLGKLPTTRAFERMVETGEFKSIVDGVQGYSVNNIEAVFQHGPDKPVLVAALTVHYIATWGDELGPQHLRGGSKTAELREKYRITPDALARAVCSRGGESVCDGIGCTKGPDPQGHQYFFPTPKEAEAMHMDYTWPLVIGMRQHVYSTRADATYDEIQEVAQKVFNASKWNSDEDRGCYLYHLISEGALKDKMVLVESDNAIRYVSRFMVPRPDPHDGSFIMAGSRRTLRQLVQGSTSQINVRPEPKEWKLHETTPLNTYGHKASVRRHGENMDAMMVSTLFITDTADQGGSKKMNRHPVEDKKQKRGIWMGATWMARENSKGNVKSCVIPLPLLYMALGVVDDKTLLKLCAYDSADHVEQKKGIVKSIETAREMIDNALHIPDHYILADKARVFFVESASRLNYHQNFGTGPSADFEAMVNHFYDHIVPKIITGIEEYDSLVRLATLQGMAMRVVQCTSELITQQQNHGYETIHKPTDPNHWGEMRVYGYDTFVAQEIRKGLRRSLGNLVVKFAEELKKSGWDTKNIDLMSKFGGGSNSARQFIVKDLTSGRRVISGLSVVCGGSLLQQKSEAMTLMKEGGDRTPESVRAQHNTAYGMVSPNETPEGQKVGLVNKMSINAVVSPPPLPGTDELLRDILLGSESFVDLADLDTPLWVMREDYMMTRPGGVEMAFVLADPSVVRVTWNGIVIGITPSPVHLIRRLWLARRRCSALRYMSAAFHHGEVVIQTTSCRLGRWMWVLDDTGKIPLPEVYCKLLLGSFQHLNQLNLTRLLDLGVVEFVSALEAESIKILHGKPKWTPCVFHKGKMYESPVWIDEIKRERHEELAEQWQVLQARLDAANGMDPTELIEFTEDEDPDVIYNRAQEAMYNLVVKIRADMTRVGVSMQENRDRIPIGIPEHPGFAYRFRKFGQYTCVALMDTHMDPHPELMLGVGAAVHGFTGFNQSARESIQSHHGTHAVGHAPDGMLETSSFTSRKVRRKISRNLVETMIGGFVPLPGQRMMFQAVMSEGAWLSEDATSADRMTNDLDECARMSGVFCKTRTVRDTPRFPMPASDKANDLILCFPGQKGEGERVRAMQATGMFEPDFQGFAEDDDGLFEFINDPQVGPFERARHRNYSKICADGLPCPGTIMYENDVVIGLVGVVGVDMTEWNPEDPKGKNPHLTEHKHILCYTDMSVVWDKAFPARVKSVVVASRQDGKMVVKVKLEAEVKTESLGNKSSVPAGQKGVISLLRNIGDEWTIRHHDPRYSSLRLSRGYGPHGWKRMTLALQWSMSLGWLALERMEVVRGTFGDCKMTNEDLVEIRRLLRTECNIPPGCDFVVTNPETGLPIGKTKIVFDPPSANGRRNPRQVVEPTTIFCGPVAELKQPQIAEWKCRAMVSGQVDVLTRQPKKGSDGGLRFGEMEVQSLLAHGTSVALKDRMFYSSDPYRILVCSGCGLPAGGTKDDPQCISYKCDGPRDIVQVDIPYASKLFIQELHTMGISTRLMTDEVEAGPSGPEYHTSESEEDVEDILAKFADMEVNGGEHEEVQLLLEEESDSGSDGW